MRTRRDSVCTGIYFTNQVFSLKKTHKYVLDKLQIPLVIYSCTPNKPLLLLLVLRGRSTCILDLKVVKRHITVIYVLFGGLKWHSFGIFERLYCLKSESKLKYNKKKNGSFCENWLKTEKLDPNWYLSGYKSNIKPLILTLNSPPTLDPQYPSFSPLIYSITPVHFIA